MSEVVLIGYWRSEREGQWPDPREFVDDTWDASERDMVASYLASAPIRAASFRGLSPCRLCGVLNGSEEFTDGMYLWPQGLSHYVGDHSVRLPRRVLDHVREHTDDFEQYDWRSLRPEWRATEPPRPRWVPATFKGDWPPLRKRFARWRLQWWMRRRAHTQDKERLAAGQSRIARIDREVRDIDLSWWRTVRPDS